MDWRRWMLAIVSVLAAACGAAPVSGYQSVIPLMELEDAGVEHPQGIEGWSDRRVESDPFDLDPSLPIDELRFEGSLGGVDVWSHVREGRSVGVLVIAEEAALYHTADLANSEGTLELVLTGRCEADRPTSGFAAIAAGDLDVAGFALLGPDGWRYAELRNGVAALPDALAIEGVKIRFADGSIKRQDLMDLPLC